VSGVGNFEEFYRDMGDPPFPGAMLERQNNDLGYIKDNCVWATRAEQNRNRRNTVYYEFRGERLILADWAQRLNIKLCTLAGRIYTSKWPIEKAFTTPPKGNNNVSN